MMKSPVAITLQRTHSGNTDFIALVRQLDSYLSIMDGKDHSFYDQYNKVTDIKHVVVAFENTVAVACGAIKEYAPGIMEVKRMFTVPQYRGRGIATLLLQDLEKWAAELGYHTCILETGKRQTEAVHLYPKNGYTIIPNYGQYRDVENSICFEKKLR